MSTEDDRSAQRDVQAEGDNTPFVALESGDGGEVSFELVGPNGVFVYLNEELTAGGTYASAWLYLDELLEALNGLKRRDVDL